MKSILFFLLERLNRFLLSHMGSDTRRVFCTRLVSTQNLIIPIQGPYGELLFYCPSELTAWRANTLFTKEPETIEWIDAMPQNAVLWDIGANVGCYTIYAAKKGLRVMAFEPAFTNFSILNTNILMNDLCDHARAYCLAISEMHGLGLLELSSLDAGGALAGFHGEKTESEAFSSHGVTRLFTQGMMGWSIDGLMEMPGTPCPNFIKIDVDGIELQIVQGARKTLRDPRLKGLMIEIEEDDVPTSEAIIALIQDAGLVLESRRQAPIIGCSQHSTIFNYFFARKLA